MTNKDLMQNLKQFTLEAISQSEARLTTHLRQVDKRLSVLETRVGDIQNAIADALVQANESAETLVYEHEQRLHRLKRRP
jgi:hypothetical protein